MISTKPASAGQTDNLATAAQPTEDVGDRTRDEVASQVAGTRIPTQPTRHLSPDYYLG